MAERKPPVRRRKRSPLLLLAELVIVAVLIGTGALFYVSGRFDTQELDAGQIQTNKLDKETRELVKGYTTIAMFGLDSRRKGNYKSGNTDVIMVVSINNDTKDIKVISVYRDTLLDVSGGSADFQKCNSAYAYGGPEGAISMLNKSLDLSIDNYAAFDFSAVAAAIDILGGVEIEIESESELRYLNKYIRHTNGLLGTDAELVDSPGTHTLDGVQAVAYSRIRYTAGGDFKRAQRQRIVLSQMMGKAKKANVAQLTKLVTQVFPMISTDLKQDQMIALVRAATGYSMDDMRGFPFERSTATLSGRGSCVIACDLETNVRELQEFLYGNDSYEPSQTIKDYNEQLIRITGHTRESAVSDKFDRADNAPPEDEEEVYDEDNP